MKLPSYLTQDSFTWGDGKINFQISFAVCGKCDKLMADDWCGDTDWCDDIAHREARQEFMSFVREKTTEQVLACIREEVNLPKSVRERLSPFHRYLWFLFGCGYMTICLWAGGLL